MFGSQQYIGMDMTRDPLKKKRLQKTIAWAKEWRVRVFKPGFSTKIITNFFFNWKGAKVIKFIFGLYYNLYFSHTYIFYVVVECLLSCLLLRFLTNSKDWMGFLKLLGSSLKLGKVRVSQLRWKVRWHLTFDLMLEFGHFVSHDSRIEKQNLFDYSFSIICVTSYSGF